MHPQRSIISSVFKVDMMFGAGQWLIFLERPALRRSLAALFAPIYYRTVSHKVQSNILGVQTVALASSSLCRSSAAFLRSNVISFRLIRAQNKNRCARGNQGTYRATSAFFSSLSSACNFLIAWSLLVFAIRSSHRLVFTPGWRWDRLWNR